MDGLNLNRSPDRKGRAMNEAVVVEVVRTPVGRGKMGGALSGVHAVELLAMTLATLMDKVAIDPALVDDVLVGCVSQAGEQAACPGRVAWLGAGLPESVPATTIDRRCGSSQQAAHFAAHGIMAGAYDIAVVAGIESMSRVPMGAARMGHDAHGPSIEARYAPGLVPQGVSAELVAAKWGLSRQQLDEYSARSHERAAETARSGGFDNEIVPVTVPGADGGPASVVSADETIRVGTTVERLAGLQPSFRTDAMADRFPEIDWSITPGNSSQLADGAVAMLVMSAERAAELGMRARARFHSFSVCGDDPILMLSGPIRATELILKRSGLSIGDIDAAEINEAFAPVPLAWQAEFGLDDSKLNPRGGAIALGHPLGASGLRLMATLINHLEQTGGRFGLQAMCEGSGMANATILERL
jgi:acetyl-CoA acyltransferase